MNLDKGRKDLIKALNSVMTSINRDDVRLLSSEKNAALLIFEKIINDNGNWYISLSDEFGKITYAKSTEDKLSVKKRVKTSFRRFIRRQLSIDSTMCSDAWLDWFGCQVLSYLPYDINDKISILYENDIVKFYTKTFVDTCMTGSDNRLKIAFYANNPDKVGLVVFNNFVRAFLWHTDEGNFVLDRVYPAGNKDLISLIRKWAKEKEFCLRTNADGVVPKQETVAIDGNIINHVTMKIQTQYPYLDTFRFGNFNEKTVTLSNSNKFGNMSFVRTNGAFIVDMICTNCSERIFDNNYHTDLIRGGYCCHNCYTKNYTRCRNCSCLCDRNVLSYQQTSMMNKYGYIYCNKCAKMHYFGVI